MTKITNHFKTEEERVFFKEVFQKLIDTKLATFVRYEKSVWYFSPDGQKRCIHPDFVIQGKTDQIRIVIEIDGIQHQQSDAIINDAMRDATLTEMGYHVLRFSISDLRECLKGCIEKIKRVLEAEEIRLIEAAQKRKLNQLKQKGVL